jgi:hypothetical protein
MMFSTNASRFFLVLAAAYNAVTSADHVNAVDLGFAGGYAILTKTGISTVPLSPIIGNIGVSPIGSTAITGFNLMMDVDQEASTSAQVDGEVHAASYNALTTVTPTLLTAAVSAMETAYDDAAGRAEHQGKTNIATGVLGPVEGAAIKQLTPGVYTFTTGVSITQDIYFNGDGVYIIRMSGALLQTANTSVYLMNGAKAENIFWQVASNVVVGAGAHMEGTLLVKTDALFQTESSLNGRVLAQTACNLQKASITIVPAV